MVQYTYCPACDKDVEIIEVSMGTRGGGSSLRCIECGQVLAELSEKKEGEDDDKAAALTRVITAGYTGVQNDLLVAALLRIKYADTVEQYANGEEFLSRVTGLLHKEQKPKLIILEVQMPIMNGINSALCLRSIEKGIGEEKVPILFFTRKPLDDSFTRAIKFLTPAKYVPLPSNVDAETFKARADQMAELLKDAEW